MPFTAAALKTGSRPRRASATISSSDRTLSRSRLLNWMTTGQLLDGDPELLEVLPQVEERRGVVLGLADLRIGDERDAVGALQDEAASRGVEHLARHGEDLEAQRHAGAARRLRPEGDRQHVEEERAVVLRLERHQAPAGGLGGELVQRSQVRRLPAERRPVVDELYGHFSGGEIQLHGRYPTNVSPTLAAEQAWTGPSLHAKGSAFFVAGSSRSKTRMKIRTSTFSILERLAPS